MKTPKEQFKTALLLEDPEPGSRLPLWELEFHGWELFSGKRFLVGTEFTSLTAREKDRALALNAEIIAEVSAQLHFSAVTVPGGYWEIAPGHPAYFWLPPEARMEQIRILHRALGNRIMLVAGNPAVLAMPAADEYMEFAVTLMERPERVEERARKLCRSGMEEATRLLDLGIGALYTASDLADNHGPWFDPQQMERLILPFLDRWAGHVNRLGGLSILHSDGNLDPVISRIAETSVHALQAIDPVAGMDLPETLRKVAGNLCLCGNIDCTLFLRGSAEEVFGNTSSLLKLVRQRTGWVLGASNAIERSMRREHYLSFLEAWKRYGGTGS